MVNSCSAYGCKNRNSKGSTITFHRFPLNNKSLLKLWLYQIKRGNWEPSKYSVICSEHFTEDCFVIKGLQNSRRTLKSDAYPTIFSMAIYSEPPKKKTFPGRKSVDVTMNEDSKEENLSTNEDTKEEDMSTDDGTKKESANEDSKSEDSDNKNAEEEDGKTNEAMEDTAVDGNSDAA